MALNNLHFIGLNGELPWRSSEDLKHFKKLTKGCVLICGYNTLLKLPPLEGRVVLEATPELIQSIYDEPHLYKDDWCIGGAKTYMKLAPLFTEFHISYINDDTIGDTFAPDLNLTKHGCKIYRYKFNVNK